MVPEEKRDDNLQRTEIEDRKKSMDLMLLLGLHETMDQLAMANSVRWYGHVLKREDGYGKQCSLVWSCVEERGWLWLTVFVGMFMC